MVRIILIIFLFPLISSNLIRSNYDYDSKPTQTKFEIRLNSNFKIECQKEVLDDYKFDRLIFNRSESNLDEYIKPIEKIENYISIKSYVKFNEIFYLIDKQWDVNQVFLNSLKYSDSGRYYCVYSTKKSGKFVYLVESYQLVVYDEVTIIKNFKETVELDACVDSKNESKSLGYIQWYYNIDVDSEINNYMKFNSQTSGLIISVDNFDVFDIIFQCKNFMTGSYKIYRLECSNCDISAPLILPARQIVTENSDTQFTCEKPLNTNEPDRYQWFKHSKEVLPSDSETVYDFTQSIGYGSILDLKNITVKNAGWYICCLVNSKSSVQNKIDKINTDTKDDETPRFSCSSVELKVIAKKAELRDILFYLLTGFCVIVILIMGTFIFLCTKKLTAFKHTEKARDYMKNNDFYLTEEDFKNFQKKYQTTSSIEALLSDDDIHKWKIPLDSLKIGKEIGRGAFGVVVHGFLNAEKPKRDVDSGIEYTSCTSDGRNSSRSIDVAIKKLPDTANEYNYYEMFKELQLMLSVGQHPHIVNLVGYCVEDSSLNIVLEFAKFGNLKDFLRNDFLNEKTIGPDHLFLYAYQAAQGMEYLHSKNILHRDLAARNILVEDNDSIKIADFGLARNINSNYYYIQNLNGKVPFKWMSPESLSFEKVSKESDLWSYGVLLWEIYSYGCTPYPSIEQEDLLEKLKSGYRMERPEVCDSEIYDLIMLQCWNAEPKKRPSFTEIVKIYEELLEKSNNSLKTLINEKKNKLNYDFYSYDEKYFELSKARSSNCSFYQKDERLQPPKNWLSTSSVSSFNPSTSTNTTSTSHSDDIIKQQTILFNLKKDDHLEEKPLISKKFFQKTTTDKKTRKNPIYGERSFDKEIKALINKDTKNELETLNTVNNNKNWMNLFGILQNVRQKTQIIITEVSSEQDIEMGIGLMWTAFEKLRHILTSSKLDLKLRMRIFNAACIPVLLYGCESWTLIEASSDSLNCLVRTFYRIICGIKQSETHKINEELYKIVKQ
ncbi:unnamed protein product [Brachionus calyciflorus]|uniref:Receptor protein-tyrosine kinase n=1 Tax=Brachionus calyciflorus TaxID=104777 RepID=A0A813VLT4_9BILA|nr:unnamed protein product [Brachionus calyciflorus]